MNALRFLTPFFLNHAVHSSISTLSLHDALPISGPRAARRLIAVDERSDARELGLEPRTPARSPAGVRTAWLRRSEEHTSELQSHSDLVCRLLLEKKKCTTVRSDRRKRPSARAAT